MNILVIGGAGYIGSTLCQQALSRSCWVTSVDNLIYSQGHTQSHLLTNSRYRFIKADVRDISSYKNELNHADAVIHLAAIVGAPACSKHPDLAQTVNSDSVRSVVKELSKQQYFVYPNTNSGYGTVPNITCTEETPLNPISLYGRTKLEGEKIALEHPASTIFRLATVFGVSPRMRLDLLVNTLAYVGYYQKEIKIFDGDLRRNFVYVGDVARAMINCLSLPKFQQEVFNFGNDDINMTKTQLAEVIASVVGAKVLEGSGVDPDRRDYVVSSKKFTDAIDFDFTTLRRGLSELVEWFRMLPKPGSIDHMSQCGIMNTTCSHAV